MSGEPAERLPDSSVRLLIGRIVLGLGLILVAITDTYVIPILLGPTTDPALRSATIMNIGSTLAVIGICCGSIMIGKHNTLSVADQRQAQVDLLVAAAVGEIEARAQVREAERMAKAEALHAERAAREDKILANQDEILRLLRGRRDETTGFINGMRKRLDGPRPSGPGGRLHGRGPEPDGPPTI